MKNIVSVVKSIIYNKEIRFDFMTQIGIYRKMSNQEYIKKKYRIKMGKELNLENPLSYNEKLQWIKVNYYNPLYTKLVDKYEVKEYVKEKIGGEYVIPTLGLWDNFADIDFNKLPNQFVLKCTHDSGGIVICKDKNLFDYKKTKKQFDIWLKRNYYDLGREWPYKDIKPRIIAEKYMEDKEYKELRDYKFFAFRGNVKALFVATERQKEGEDVKFDFFDENFTHLPFKQGHENATIIPPKPKEFEKMKEIVSVLSKEFPHVRVDLYEVDEKIYFGEMTFFHHGGWSAFEPEEWDYRFGEWINLREISR